MATDGLGPPSPSSAPGRHDSPLFEPTPRQIPDMIGSLPDEPCVHLDRAYDSAATRDLLKELGYGHEIAPKCIPAPDPGGEALGPRAHPAGGNPEWLRAIDVVADRAREQRSGGATTTFTAASNCSSAACYAAGGVSVLIVVGVFMGVFSGVRRGVLAAVPAATVAVLSLTGLISVAPAYAATGHPVSGRSAHPDDDHLGSTIRAHEPSTVNPQVVGPQVVRPNASGPTVAVGPQQLGMDVSNHQGVVGWASAVADGAQFVYIKATEGTGFLDGQFDTNYAGSYNAGLIRGAYHFALPDVSTGVVQANYFADHGGGWSADGRTLPPMLDIEYDPYSADPCYGLSGTQMSSWIRDFSATVQARTGRYPTIYTTARWWNTCTAQNTTFGDANPLFVACYCSTPGSMPAGWGYQTIWQYNDQGLFPGDQDVFNGSLDQLRTFATASQAPTPTPPPAPAGSVQVLPGSAEAGGVIGISVTGWSPNTTLSLTLDGTGLSSTVTTHDDGSAIVVLNVAPDTSVGTHTVLVAATSTKPVAVTGSFQVTALVPFSPYQILSAVLRLLFGL